MPRPSRIGPPAAAYSRDNNSRSSSIAATPRSAAPLPTLGQEIGKRRPFDSAPEEAFLNILRTASVLSNDASRFIKGYGLSEPQYNALRILRGHGPRGVPSQTIGEQLVAQVPDVTRLVDRLVENGWAERTRTVEDRRVVLVRATKAGLDLLAKLDKPLRALHEEQLGHLTAAETATLNKLMVKARARCAGGDGDVRQRCPK